MTLRKVSLGGLEKRELVGWVQSLVFSGSSSLIRVDDELDVLVVHLGDDSAAVDENVSGELSMDFLQQSKGKRISMRKNWACFCALTI